jgi:hypothetical protein
MLDLRFHDLNTSSSAWEEIYKIAREDRSHLLWENYQNIDITQYETMVVTTCEDRPASFQGIYNRGRWPENVSRFCNRAYINPYFRNQGHGLEITWRNINYTLDNYNKWNKDVLFISRGVQYDNVEVSWLKFKKFCQFLIEKTGYNLQFDDKLYQCCPKLCKDCYQFCVWYDPKDLRKSLEIASVSKEQWTLLE